MHPGDFIITPSRTFHDHGNLTDTPTIWMDGLDLPIINYFDAGFAERYPGEREQPVTRDEGDAYSRYGANLMPLNFEPKRASSPIFNYPYSRSREVLDDLYRRGPLDPCHGIKMQFVNPATGGYPIPSISTFIQFLPKGFKTAPYRSTDATVFIAIEGRGKSRVAETSLVWNTRDIFVVPSWNSVVHEAAEDTVLFSFSDRAAQKVLGFWREQSLG
jgi:gentisate 1,2-dioxygenase